MDDRDAVPVGPEITAIVCTHNRAAVIGDTLKSLAAQTLPRDRFEILVVDNASSDNTREVVLDFQKSNDVHLRYLAETRLGIAIARNRGWQAAATEFLAYLDDDARAEPNWLEAHLETLKLIIPPPACVTGFVELDWVGGRPVWFPARFESLLARYDFGPDAKWHSRDGYLLTCNAAFRTQVLRDLGGFREGLGHRGNELHGGEDNEMFSRLNQHGWPVYYQPRAKVNHWTPPQRQTRQYLLERLYASGLSQAALDVLIQKKIAWGLWQTIGWDAGMVVRYLGRFLLSTLKAESSLRWDHLYGLVQKLGRLRTELALAGLPLTFSDARRARQLKSIL